MKLVAISRVRNEADIIEAFVRHHAAHFDKLIVLDDGSSDGTLPMLHALQAAGLPLVVLQEESIAYDQRRYMTRLLHLAVEKFGADWVAPLDADEFIEPQNGMTLAEVLAGREPDSLAMAWDNFLWRPENDRDPEPNPVRRLRLRFPPASGHSKVLVSAKLVHDGISIAQGNHFLRRDGKKLPVMPLDAVRLCHYPIRSVAQYAGKIAVGYLKYAAWPEWDGQLGSHYIAPYRALLTGGVAALEQRMNTDSRAYSAPGERVQEEDEARDRPLDYRGGPLALSHAAETPLQNVLRYSQGLAEALVARAKEVKSGVESLKRIEGELAAALDTSRQFAARQGALEAERTGLARELAVALDASQRLAARQGDLEAERASLARELAAALDASHRLTARQGDLEAERASLARELAAERHRWLPWRLRHLFSR
jgi:hypothetical protein